MCWLSQFRPNALDLSKDLKEVLWRSLRHYVVPLPGTHRSLISYRYRTLPGKYQGICYRFRYMLNAKFIVSPLQYRYRDIKLVQSKVPVLRLFVSSAHKL
jgi:hypothetical protein